MGRKKDDKIWQDFVQMGGVSKCKHCKTEFKGKPSVSRLRKHLLGDKGGGICVCTKVPGHVKAAILDDSNKRRRIEPPQINIGVENSSSTSSQRQNQHFEQVQRMQEAVQDDGEEMGQYQILEDMFGQGINIDELGDLGIHNGVFGAHEIRGEALFINELVGEKFEVNVKKICSSLMKEEVLRIGIHGMGGVGKTELAKHVHNKLLDDPNFRHVYWVEVTQDFSVRNLQNAIAKAVGLDLTNEDAEHKRVIRLQKELIQNKPFVLILDDVWSCIYSEEVGIPNNLNGCKLVLTTRSQDICLKMRCQKKIQVRCLEQSLPPLAVDWKLAEDWKLFTKILSPERSLLTEVEEVAKSIVWHCGGLPLMIKCMARAMVGVAEIYEWRSALEAMKESKWSKDNRQVFQCLKRSYDHLQDPTLQQCFLYIPLLENLYLSREEIIIRLIAEGIIDNGRSWREKVSEGHALLNKLQKVCLLNDCLFKMHLVHRLVKNMAFQIMKDESVPSLVEVNKKLEDLPDKKHWTMNLVRASLAGNNLKEISSDHLPICPNLSTLILCHNYWLHSIADSFFSQLPGLKVLDLSDTAIHTLPESIGCLQNLTSLFLTRCRKLKEMPSLAMLGSLEVLDLSYCSGIRKVSQGLERLSNLKYLNLFGAKVEEFSEGILKNLTHLQFLSIDLETTTSSIKIAEELACLSELETLSCRFTNFQEFEKYVGVFSLMSTKKKMELLKLYYLYVGPCDFFEEEIPIGQTVKFSYCSISGRVRLLHKVEVAEMCRVSIEDGKGLCLQNALGLKTFKISYCEGIEYLFSLSSSTSIFQSLQTVSIVCVEDLQLLFGAEAAPTISCLPDTPFSNLTSFQINNCPRMKQLFPFALIGNLRNLETIEVSFCQGMEEIITAQELGDITGAKLPHLKHLQLRNLPNLKKVCSTQLECNSLLKITIIDCEELKDMPISLPLPSLQKLKVSPQEWWASMSWGHPDQKNALKPDFSLWW